MKSTLGFAVSSGYGKACMTMNNIHRVVYKAPYAGSNITLSKATNEQGDVLDDPW